MIDPARQWRWVATVWLVVLALGTSACAWPGSGQPEAPYVVSYAGAAERLTTLDPLEAEEQLRDWARLGLASSLGLNRKQIFDALYDTTPIRDPLFTDLAEQPTGPGRALFDGTTLHLLVPQDDPHPSRTIGLLLDEHRVDAGADPGQVQVHRYRMLPENQRIELVAEPATATSQLRADHGWREERVDQSGGLADFLAHTTHLSRLENRGTEVWAAGWSWPDLPGALVSAEDVSVLQRGYRGYDGTPPGFSLDPQPPSTLDDIRATIPGLAPDLAERIYTGNWLGSGCASVVEFTDLVESMLFQQDPQACAPLASGLPADPTRLWALWNFLVRGTMYSQARYDGGLKGTEVGMTLFYTDFVAKEWKSVGTGVLSDAVPGFMSDAQATTPPSLCPRPGDPLHEFGRLWFGQNDTAFTFEPNGVGIGAQATRLFARSDGSDGPGGSEVESSFSFGRGLRWWDQHYQAVADYEPQYQRLEQLMRWSGALEWLTTSGHGLLPSLPDREIPPAQRFADWYHRHDELRERAPLTVVTPPSANNEEAVLHTPSAVGEGCGLLQIFGGVSLADGLARSRGLPSGTAALPPAVRRAGPTDPATTAVDPVTSVGRIDRVALDETGPVTERVTILRSGPEVASARSAAGPRSSIPAGRARLQGETGPRLASTEIRSDGRDSTYIAKYQDVLVAQVDVRVPPSSGVRQTDISLGFGFVEHFQAAIEKIRQDPAHGLDAVPGVRYSYPGPDGQTVYRFDDGRSATWAEVGTGPTSLQTSFVAEVVTLDGAVVQVRVGKPKQLSDVDVNSLEITQEGGVTTFGSLRAALRSDVPIYRGDVASIVGPEPAAILPAAIPYEARVHYRVAQTTGGPTSSSSTAGSAGPIPREGRTWSLVNTANCPPDDVSCEDGGGPGSGNPGSGGPGGGGVPPIGQVAPGQLVLITVCPASTEGQLPQSADCQ